MFASASLLQFIHHVDIYRAAVFSLQVRLQYFPEESLATDDEIILRTLYW